MPVGAERDAIDDADEPPECPDQAVAFQVPQLDRSVSVAVASVRPLGLNATLLTGPA
jgi:hypothetical protein